MCNTGINCNKIFDRNTEHVQRPRDCYLLFLLFVSLSSFIFLHPINVVFLVFLVPGIPGNLLLVKSKSIFQVFNKLDIPPFIVTCGSYLGSKSRKWTFSKRFQNQTVPSKRLERLEWLNMNDKKFFSKYKFIQHFV